MSFEINGTSYESQSAYELGVMFEALVPAVGNADTVAGEIVRAVSKIGYRHFNDGDMINRGYGKETCNPAARYLGKNTDEKVKTILYELGDAFNDAEYEEGMLALYDSVLSFLKANPELENTPNEEDMYDYAVKEEDRDDTWDDEDDEDEEDWD